MTLADRIAVMRAGRIIQIGTPGEVYERPHTRFISNFLGNSNFFAGRLLDCRDGLAHLQAEDGPVLVTGCDRLYPPGAPLTLVVRPEKIRLYRGQPPENLQNRLEAQVVHRVYMGTSTTYLLQPAAGERVTVFAQNEGSRPAFETGETVTAAWEADACFLLDE